MTCERCGTAVVRVYTVADGPPWLLCERPDPATFTRGDIPVEHTSERCTAALLTDGDREWLRAHGWKVET